MCGEAADDLHRRRQDSELEDASFDRTDIAAVTKPKDVSCDRLDEWRFGVCSLKCQNETAEIALQNTVDRTRRVKTILRYTTRRYSHDSLGHCEEVEKQIRAMISHTWRADHKCDSDRHVAWTITHHMIKAEELTSFFKWMSKDEHGEVAKFDERSWSRSIAKTSKLAEQWNDAHERNRTEEHPFVIKGLNRSVRAGRKQARDEKVEFGRCQSSFKSYLGTESEYGNRHIKLPDRSTTRINRCTNTGLHHVAQDAPGIQEFVHLSAGHELRSSGPKSLLKQKLQVTLSGPDVREIESLKSTGATGKMLRWTK